MILCDAGVLLCLVDRTQPQHNAYRATVTGLAKPLITTWSCLTFKSSDGMHEQKRRITTLLEQTEGRSWWSCESSLQPLNRNVMPLVGR